MVVSADKQRSGGVPAETGAAGRVLWMLPLVLASCLAAVVATLVLLGPSVEPGAAVPAGGVRNVVEPAAADAGGAQTAGAGATLSQGAAAPGGTGGSAAAPSAGGGSPARSPTGTAGPGGGGDGGAGILPTDPVPAVPDPPRAVEPVVDTATGAVGDVVETADGTLSGATAPLLDGSLEQ